ncbi:hypothetical protein CA54_00580 [Symmachiella macrocystis]|uniref:Ferric uptake regulation protein n=1 Tax=Symmachiella macrocystis TaxID=2527985 RepID=A0A5C6BGG1_9PLAN|nr:transcriptional repressor [Symmachiella macrocystis]TWU11253.1 hypothetical protein CA54_00580 [Symmachiella macrocystis]
MTAEKKRISVEDASDLLKRVGLRKTFTRINVLQCLALQTIPITHAKVTEQLSPLGFDASTVFRGLSDLVDAAIVARLDVGDRIWRFELRDEIPSSNTLQRFHPHILCRICERIECLDMQHHCAEENPLTDWHIEEVFFRGICADCLSIELGHPTRKQ